MKIGVDYSIDRIYVESTAGSASIETNLAPAAARLMALQLNESADALDKFNEGEFGVVEVSQKKNDESQTNS